MLLAVRAAPVTAGFDETTSTLPLFTRLPVRMALAELLKSMTAVAPLATFKVETELRAAASRMAVARVTV